MEPPDIGSRTWMRVELIETDYGTWKEVETRETDYGTWRIKEQLLDSGIRTGALKQAKPCGRFSDIPT